MRFLNKVVVVTGGGFGIGRGIALRFASEGARVAILDLNRRTARETADKIAELGGEASVFQTDIANGKRVVRTVKMVEDEFGRIDVLVNNAGIRFVRPVLEMRPAEWERTVGVNLNGIFHMVRSAAPAMLKSGSGKIVNIASVSGFLGQTGRAAYGATKAAIVQLTRSLAVELAPMINVNAVAPGYIRGTGMMAEVDKDVRSAGWMVESTPIRRPGTPEDVAAAVAFLASDEASFITGVTLPVDGGFSASKYMVRGKF